MNVKRIFGGVLTVLGMAGLIYTGIVFVINTPGTRDIKVLVVFGTLGIIFFLTGIGLVRTTKDES